MNTVRRAARTARKGARIAADAAEDVAGSRALDAVARVGFALMGLLHLLIGAIAVRIAFGDSAEADQAGAMEELAAHPSGPVLLIAGFVGCLGTALWQAGEAVVRGRRLQGRSRLRKIISASAEAVIYAAVGGIFGSFAFGGGSDSSESVQDFTAALMAHPAGVPLLVVLGGVIMGVGVYFIQKGLRRKFKDELQRFDNRRRGQVLDIFAAAGYTAKGLALNLLGLLFVVAAFKHDAEESTGLDGSLKALREQPFGLVILTAIGLGLIGYGLYSMVRARYGRM